MSEYGNLAVCNGQENAICIAQLHCARAMLCETALGALLLPQCLSSNVHFHHSMLLELPCETLHSQARQSRNTAVYFDLVFKCRLHYCINCIALMIALLYYNCIIALQRISHSIFTQPLPFDSHSSLPIPHATLLVPTGDHQCCKSFHLVCHTSR